MQIHGRLISEAFENISMLWNHCSNKTFSLVSDFEHRFELDSVTYAFPDKPSLIPKSDNKETMGLLFLICWFFFVENESE